ELAGKVSWAIDVSTDHVERRDPSSPQPLTGDSSSYLAGVSANQHQRVAIQYPSARGFRFNGPVNMFQKGAVPTAHVTDALRLLVKGSIEQLRYDRIALLEVVAVGPSTAPDIHTTIDQELAAGFINSRHVGVAEHEHRQHIEHRQIRDSNAV